MKTQFRRKTIYACLVLTTLLLLLIVIGAGGVSALGSSTDNYMPGWYMISNQNKDGIALRDAPSTSGNLIKRFPYGTRFYVDAVSGHWGSTIIDGYSGWTHLGYSAYLGGSPLGDPVSSPGSTTDDQYTSGSKDYLVQGTGYYTISTTYKPGIALHPEPDHSSAILTRIENGTKLYISEIVDNYGHTTYGEHNGWINLDYAVFSGKLESYVIQPEASPTDPGGTINKDSFTEAEVRRAVWNYVELQWGSQASEHHGYHRYDGYDENNRTYQFYIRSYTGAHAEMYVSADTGEMYEEWTSPLTGELEPAQYAGNVADYLS